MNEELFKRNLIAALGDFYLPEAGIVSSVTLLAANRLESEWPDELLRVAAAAIKMHLLASMHGCVLPADSRIEIALEYGIKAANFVRSQRYNYAVSSDPPVGSQGIGGS